MSDDALQSLLDPDGNGRGITILRRIEDGSQHIAYYVNGGNEFAGRDRWVRVKKLTKNAAKVKAIREALAFP